ncbi:unnamed protein product, partial [Mesorhabditis belari]|uniref:Sulfotransferase n=1 Tax=Mesorhabditis belari TaxID=2138241 RepID=A0AAF3J1T0_9BILA
MFKSKKKRLPVFQDLVISIPLIEICPPGKNDLCSPPFKAFINKYRFSPHYHLSACVIEKSMSTMLAAVMCYLYDTQAFLDANRTLGNELFEHRFCKGKNEKGSLQEIHQTAPKADWNYLAIIREPIDRFLSGFTDKCVKETKRGRGKCYNCNGNLSCFVQKQYKRTLDYASGKMNAIGYEDVHFFPQSWRCGFSSHLAKYSLIQYGGHGSEFDRMTDQLFDGLRDAGVEQKDIEWIASQMENGRTSHATRTSPERQKFENELRGDKELMKMVVRMFYYDFLLFGFPLPVIKE